MDIQPHFIWLALGLALAAAEMAVPGVFLIWMAIAALITGAISWAVPDLGTPWQVIIFAALAIMAVFSGRRWLTFHPVEAADPKMNARGARAVGETVIITQAIEAGSGRAKLGDSEWLVKGPDAEQGARMRVTGSEGTILLVEHLH